MNEVWISLIYFSFYAPRPITLHAGSLWHEHAHLVIEITLLLNSVAYDQNQNLLQNENENIALLFRLYHNV